MANLYATVEFFKAEIRKKNLIIKSLLDSQSILQKKLIETKPTCHNSNCETPNPLASSIDGNNSALYQLVDEFNNNEHSFEDNLRSNKENLIATSNNSVSPVDLNPANDHIVENDATESAIKENLEVVLNKLYKLKNANDVNLINKMESVNKTPDTWPNGTILITGDSMTMFNNIDETRLSKIKNI